MQTQAARCYRCGRVVPEEEITQLTVIEGLSERRYPFHPECAATVKHARWIRAGLALLVAVACFAGPSFLAMVPPGSLLAWVRLLLPLVGVLALFCVPLFLMEYR